jgi:hypothetical protein
VSAKFNLICEQATTFNFQFSINNDAVPLNLDGYTGTMTVRPFVGASTTTVTGYLLLMVIWLLLVLLEL